MSLEMVCNFRKCRKGVRTKAWVTSCSHVFCSDHGASEFRLNENGIVTCPACSAELKDKFDVIQADLDPTETFKSIVLAGMRPDTIIDIAMRAISFWSYQVEQETLYQVCQANYSREKVQSLEELNTLNIQKLKAELQTSVRKVKMLQVECNKKRKQAEELTAALEERNRKIQKLNFQLDAQKRKGMNINCDDESVKKKEQWMNMEELVVNQTQKNIFKFQPVNARNKRPPAAAGSLLFDFSQAKSPPPKFNFKPV